MKEIRQTKQYSEYLKSEGWTIEKIGSDFVYINKIPILGSVLKYQRPQKPDLKKLLEIAKKYRSFYIVAELNKKSDQRDFIKNSFKIINPFLPSKTLILDLKKSQQIIYESFDKDARYAIRKSENKKVTEEKNLRKFQEAWSRAAAKGRYILSVKQLENYKKSFGENMILLTNKQCTSGAMFLIADNVGYYWYGFTSNSARSTLIQYKIIFEGIKWAKKSGAKRFDFEGIYDERFPNKAWIGFSKFKKKFGGKEIEYPESLGKFMWGNIF